MDQARRLARPRRRGNKLRKLAHLSARPSRGATTLVTTGAAQSNYARLTAASARRLGLEVVLCLRAGEGAGNLALDAIFGATVVWDGDAEAIAAERDPGAVVAALRRVELTGAPG